jgi:hypothetical protein
VFSEEIEAPDEPSKPEMKLAFAQVTAMLVADS